MINSSDVFVFKGFTVCNRITPQRKMRTTGATESQSRNSNINLTLSSWLVCSAIIVIVININVQLVHCTASIPVYAQLVTWICTTANW